MQGHTGHAWEYVPCHVRKAWGTAGGAGTWGRWGAVGQGGAGRGRAGRGRAGRGGGGEEGGLGGCTRTGTRLRTAEVFIEEDAPRGTKVVHVHLPSSEYIVPGCMLPRCMCMCSGRVQRAARGRARLAERALRGSSGGAPARRHRCQRGRELGRSVAGSPHCSPHRPAIGPGARVLAMVARRRRPAVRRPLRSPLRRPLRRPLPRATRVIPAWRGSRRHYPLRARSP